MIHLIFESFLETILMVLASGIIGIILGTPLGVSLFITADGGLLENRTLHIILGFVVNCFRSIPYVILIILLMPLSRLITGTAIGTLSAIVPLTVSSTLLIARAVEEALYTVPEGLVEVGRVIGGSRYEIVLRILIPEAFPHIFSSVMGVFVSLIGFSAMAGAVGGGGLGDLAIRYGYQRYNLEILICVVFVLIALVQLCQVGGERISSRLRKV